MDKLGHRKADYRISKSSFRRCLQHMNGKRKTFKLISLDSGMPSKVTQSFAKRNSRFMNSLCEKSPNKLTMLYEKSYCEVGFIK